MNVLVCMKIKACENSLRRSGNFLNGEIYWECEIVFLKEAAAADPSLGPFKTGLPDPVGSLVQGARGAVMH